MIPIVVCSICCFTLLLLAGLRTYYSCTELRTRSTRGADDLKEQLKYSETQRAVLQLSEELKLERQRLNSAINESSRLATLIEAMDMRIRSLSGIDLDLRETLSKISFETRDLLSASSQECKTLHSAFENLQEQMRGHLERIDSESSRLSTMISSVQQKFGRG